MYQNFVLTIKSCESASGKGSKEVIRAALAASDEVTKKLIHYALNPYLVFGIRKFDKPQEHPDVDLSPADDFFNLLDMLHARDITGNAARDAVTTFFAGVTEETAKYLYRVIDKDLQAGFSAKTFVTTTGYDIPIFDVMLADKCSTEEEFEAISFPCWGSVKYDGERNIAVVKSGSVTHYSRSGKEASHLAGLFDEELMRMRELIGEDFVLDGERMASTYIDTINAKKSGKDGEAAKANMRLIAYYLMPLSDWERKSTKVTQEQSRTAIEYAIKMLSLEKISLDDGRRVENYADMMAFLSEVTTPGYDGMSEGHEGLILKVENDTYVWDRSLSWCKVKNFYEADAKILNFEFGQKRNANVMGRVNVAGYLEDGRYFEVGVGSGWSDDQRKEIAENFEKYKKLTMVVKFQEVSKPKNSDVHSLRFPTFFRFRDDKVIDL